MSSFRHGMIFLVALSVGACGRTYRPPSQAAAEQAPRVRDFYGASTNVPSWGQWKTLSVVANTDGTDVVDVSVDVPEAQATEILNRPVEARQPAIGLACPNSHTDIAKENKAKKVAIVIHAFTEGVKDSFLDVNCEDWGS